MSVSRELCVLCDMPVTCRPCGSFFKQTVCRVGFINVTEHISGGFLSDLASRSRSPGALANSVARCAAVVATEPSVVCSSDRGLTSPPVAVPGPCATRRASSAGGAPHVGFVATVELWASSSEVSGLRALIECPPWINGPWRYFVDASGPSRSRRVAMGNGGQAGSRVWVSNGGFLSAAGRCTDVSMRAFAQ